MLGRFFEKTFVFHHCWHKSAINVRNHILADDIKSSKCYGDLTLLCALRLAEHMYSKLQLS
jgi:hypothetical protein